MVDDRKYEEHSREADSERRSIRWSVQLERSTDEWYSWRQHGLERPASLLRWTAQHWINIILSWNAYRQRL